MALNLPERICEWEGCQQPFKPKREKQRFCTKKCRTAAYNARKIGPDATCPHCGKPILKA